jgi:hypothetical protein
VAQALGSAVDGTPLLPRALSGDGHPAVVAVAAVAVTARAGYGVEPVADGSGRLSTRAMASRPTTRGCWRG